MALKPCMRLNIVAVVAVLFIVAGCASEKQVPAASAPFKPLPSAGMGIDDTSAGKQDSQQQEQALPVEQKALPSARGTSIQQIRVIARSWEFEPSTIRVKYLDTVILEVTSADVDHGLSIPEFGVSTYVAAGEAATVEFVADKRGEFPFQCSVYCGAGHREMKGMLVVE